MVNGPPTPPPTTATELQDEARENPPIAEATTSLPQNRTDHYQHVLASIIEAISNKDYPLVINIAQETDYETIDNRQPSRLLIIAPLVLGHLILDELPPARYALLRLPENLASFPLSRGLMALVTSTINREHAKIYEQAETLHALAAQPDFFDKDLVPILQTLLVVFLDSFRHRTFDLLSKAYTSLPLPLASTYLGMPGPQIIAVAEKSAWSYDPSTQILSPKVRSNALDQVGPSSFNVSSLSSFHFIADSVARLEL